MSCAAIRSALALAPFSFIAFLVLGTKQAGAGARRAKLAAIQRVLSLVCRATAQSCAKTLIYFNPAGLFKHAANLIERFEALQQRNTMYCCRREGGRTEKRAFRTGGGSAGI
jgi:hypothetical protein